MARPESIALAGYYPTPTHLLPLIARLLEPAVLRHHAFVDPCAGDGAAVIGLVGHLFNLEERGSGYADIYACEMEKERYDALRCAVGVPTRCLTPRHGDAFRLAFETSQYSRSEGASVLYLNPPYDYDPQHVRLEERFLTRFAAALCDGGALVFVVPYYALAASAATLAREFTDLRCYRFPAGDFDAFKQVVLVATKRAALLEPDEAVRERVLGWSRDASAMPDLAGPPPERTPIRGFKPDHGGFTQWEIAPLDLKAVLAHVRPWHVTDRSGRMQPIASILPAENPADLLTRRYPLAMPARAAHIAAGIAAGVFNGARVEADDPRSGLPPILVKGVFDREFVAIDEKRNKDGDKVGEVQVQQPRLVVTVLDLHTSRYHTIKSSAEQTGAAKIADMTTADLLAAYGRGLMRVMLEQCPVLHDPARADHAIALATVARPLYTAQAQAAMAAVKLLGGVDATPRQRRGKAAFVLGEIGCGKSALALATGATIGAKRILVFCPPHLLDSWGDQAAAVLPEARVMVLREPADVDAFAAARDDGMVIAILSRETAKLGHGWAGVPPVEWVRHRKTRKPLAPCPACGVFAPPAKPGAIQADELARSRARCAAEHGEPADPVARLAVDLAVLLAPAAPKVADVVQLMRGVGRRRLVRAYADRDDAQLGQAWLRARSGAALRGLCDRLARVIAASSASSDQKLRAALVSIAAATDDAAFVLQLAERLYELSTVDPAAYGKGSGMRETARDLLLLTPHGSTRDAVAEKMRAIPIEMLYGVDPWVRWGERTARLAKQGSDGEGYSERFTRQDGVLSYMGNPIGALALAIEGLQLLTKEASWSRRPKCGEPLYQAIPEPRRFPLATYIARRHPNVVELLILDEGHELAGDGSAQGFAAHRLTGLGIPTLLLTGSVMNGYAESLFANQWALDPEFRSEFSRGARADFVRRYGYLKQLVEDKDKDKGPVVFGSVTDRVERTTRTIGQAPGVLPIFLLRYLLRLAVTVHKADLALDLPTCREIVVPIKASAELVERAKQLQDSLVSRIRADMFGSLAGKLWGQMSEIHSYLDRATADTGNAEDGFYTIAYPESAGGSVVASQKPFPAATILPKEAWMLAKIQEELDEGRNVMVFAWHQAVLPRLARLIATATGKPCPALDAGKVQAAKRQAWIDREVIAKGRRVLVVNPVAVQTGLNNLVHFATEIWMQNPGCNPATYRQAVGRVDRIGQRLETRIYFPIYEGTTQEVLHRLLMHKVAVSTATDGLDAQSALEAAGVGVSASLDSMAVGRQLYEILAGERQIGGGVYGEDESTGNCGAPAWRG